MSYKLNHIDLNTFGFIPGRQSNSNIALSGHLNLPKRVGKTYHNWIDENGVEPYVSASDIKFDGRELTLVGYLKGTDRADLLRRSRDLEAYVKSQTGLVELDSKWGIYEVQITSIAMTFLHATMLEVTIVMWEPNSNIDGIIPQVDNGNGIDGISLAAFGAVLISMKGERYGMPKIKENGFYLPPVTEAPVLDIELFIKGDNLTEFSNRVKSLGALLASEGTRLLTLPNDTVREFFVTEGMQVSRILSNGNLTCGFVNFQAIELEFGVGYSFYVDDDMDLFSVTPANAEYVFELNDNGELIMTI